MKIILIGLACVLAFISAGFSQTELWSTAYNGGGETGDRGPTVCDVNRDGRPDIIVLGRINNSTSPNAILVYDALNPTQVE